MKRLLNRLLYKHKNNKFKYYLLGFVRLFIPVKFFQNRLQHELARIDQYDSAYIKGRVDYYNRLENTVELSPKAVRLDEYKFKKKNKTYFFDSFLYTRYFNDGLRINCVFGDVTFVPNEPAIVKSRPIHGDNKNSVLLKLNKVRHFIFVKDIIPFQEKKNMLIGRNVVRLDKRVRFYEMYFGHPLCNLGQINKDYGDPKKWLTPKVGIDELLTYKFILCLEGHDVASNLKWVMSSNSLAVMPVPTYETWFMEGTLIPNVHYVAIKEDYSDLEERLNYYMQHTDKALQIIENANQYVAQFRDNRREDLISLMVLDKYFNNTGQGNQNI